MMKAEEIQVRVGKRRTLYLPAKVTRKLDISEGDVLIMRVENGKIILEPIPKLLVRRKKWASTTLEEFEAESEALSEEMEGEQT